MSDKEERAQQLNEAFAQIAADQVRGMSDEVLGRHAQAVVILMEAIDAEFKRRNAVKAGEADTPIKPIGRA